MIDNKIAFQIAQSNIPIIWPGNRQFEDLYELIEELRKKQQYPTYRKGKRLQRK